MLRNSGNCVYFGKAGRVLSRRDGLAPAGGARSGPVPAGWAGTGEPALPAGREPASGAPNEDRRWGY